MDPDPDPDSDPDPDPDPDPRPGPGTGRNPDPDPNPGLDPGPDPSAGCNPPEENYSCDFWKCPVAAAAANVVSKTGSIAVAYNIHETNWDCDCDCDTTTTMWQCSAENTVKGRTPMEAAVRFILTPTGVCVCVCRIGENCYNSLTT